MSTFDAVMLVILATAIVAIVAIDVWQQKKKGTLTLEAAEEIAKSIIARVALALLTDAERTYGDGTGELKMSACLEKLIALLPATVVEVLPKSFLKDQLEIALDIAKTKWMNNPRLINSNK